MATKAALRVNARRYAARQLVIAVLKPLGDGILPVWRAVLALERVAVACGEQRERDRRERRRRDEVRGRRP